METFLQDLTAGPNLPAYFNRDLNLSKGISVLYTGTSGTISIVSGVLSTNINGGSGINLSIDMTGGITLSQLVTQINTNTGYTATLLGSASVAAITLIEVDEGDIVTSTLAIPVLGSILYKVMSVFGNELSKTNINIKSALADMVLFKANGLWIDLWGEQYNVPRLLSEDDITYIARIIAEITRNRLSIRALEDAVVILDAVQVGISDGQPDVTKIVGRSVLGQNILTDREHASAQFVVSGISETNVGNDISVTTTINRNRSAGCNPIYNYTSPKFNVAFVCPFMTDVAPFAPNFIAPLSTARMWVGLGPMTGFQHLAGDLIVYSTQILGGQVGIICLADGIGSLSSWAEFGFLDLVLATQSSTPVASTWQVQASASVPTTGGYTYVPPSAILFNAPTVTNNVFGVNVVSGAPGTWIGYGIIDVAPLATTAGPTLPLWKVVVAGDVPIGTYGVADAIIFPNPDGNEFLGKICSTAGTEVTSKWIKFIPPTL